jgi:hypothetical protein
MIPCEAPSAELVEWSSTLQPANSDAQTYLILARFRDGYKCFRQILLIGYQPSMANALQAVNKELCKMIIDRKHEILSKGNSCE